MLSIAVAFIFACFQGRFHAFKEKNTCILQLFDRYDEDKGFAYVHSFDFAHTVREEDLKKARAIQVSYS